MNNFSDIVGNEKLINYFQTAIRKNTFPHAIILEGSSGMGKTMLAYALAKALLCERGGDVSCNNCSSCKAFDLGNCMDFFCPVPEKTKSLGVDDVRNQIVKHMNTAPNGNYKVFIIDESLGLLPPAQNVLLKTIEEPLVRSVFIFTVRTKQSLLHTIRSRCVILRMTPLTEQMIADKLSANGNKPETSIEIAKLSDGSLGFALSLQKDFVNKKTLAWSVIKAAEAADMPACFRVAGELEKSDDLKTILKILAVLYRNCALAGPLDKRKEHLTSALVVSETMNTLKLQGIVKSLLLEVMMLRLGRFIAVDDKA